MRSTDIHKDKDLLDLLAQVEQLVSALEHERIGCFRAMWPPLQPAPRLQEQEAARLPVLEWLPAKPAAPGVFGAAVIDALYAAAPHLRWRQTYTAAQTGTAFLQRYGYTAVIGPDGLLASTAVACGFLLLGPATTYPRHRHEAEEIYVISSGDAEWLQGDDVWRCRPPGQLVHHASGEPHAMRTGDHALLALYVWRSADLNQKAELE